MEFSISGKMIIGREERSFVKKVEAPTENAAKERTYALLGSNNGIKRNMIKIEKIEKV